LRFAILNMSDDSNKGDLAILENTILLLRRACPGAEIEVLNADYAGGGDGPSKMFEHVRGLGVAHHQAIFPRVFDGRRGPAAMASALWNLAVSLWVLAAVGALGGRAGRLIPRRHRPAFEALRSADLAILKGGSYLYSYGGTAQLLFVYRMVHQSLLALCLGKRIVALGHSVGPVVGRPARWLLGACMRRFERVVVREEISRRCVRDELRIDPARIELLPDLAFWRPESPTGQDDDRILHDVLNREGVEVDGAAAVRIGLTARHWHFPLQGDGAGRFDAYLTILANTIDRLARERGAQVFLMPHAAEDLPVSREIARRVRQGRPVVLSGDYTTVELRGLYGAMDLFVGTRIHSNIFALSAGTPVVAIAYEIPKGFGIISMIEPREFILDIAELTEERLWDVISAGLADRETLAAGVRASVRRANDEIDQRFSALLGRHRRETAEGESGSLSGAGGKETGDEAG